MHEDSHQGKERRRSRLVELGQQFYNETLRSLLEPGNLGRFVAIEPESQQYFVEDSGTAALVAAHEAMPGRLFYLVRVGYAAADNVSGYGSRVRQS